MSDKQFYFNVQTGQVEQGRQSPMKDLMGPYETREEAEHAYDIAAQRNAEWERDNEKWGEDED